jgi:hypothetical protein
MLLPYILLALGVRIISYVFTESRRINNSQFQVKLLGLDIIPFIYRTNDIADDRTDHILLLSVRCYVRFYKLNIRDRPSELIL